MYAPAAFRVDDAAELAAFIEARHFGTLVVTGPNGPQAAHVPMLVKLPGEKKHVERSDSPTYFARKLQIEKMERRARAKSRNG